MSPPVRLLVLVLVGVVAAVALHQTTAVSANAGGFAKPTAASRAHSFTFDGVSPADQQLVMAAVQGAQPDARRLIEAVAGLTTISVGVPGDGAAGVTQTTPTGYDVELDLAGVGQALGPRGDIRLILHELGHVVRFALVPKPLLDQLDAGIPQEYQCGPGLEQNCTDPEERFAESFSKWGANDIGVGLNIGYRIAPPSMGLAAWAAPLTQLDR